MPQIAQIGEIYASQLFWLVIFFGAIFIVVGLGMLPKIQSTVDARDARIAADLEEAETARETADRLEEAYRERMDKSRAEAARLAAEAKAPAARATEAEVAEADQAINAQGRGGPGAHRRGAHGRAGARSKRSPPRRRRRWSRGSRACRSSAGALAPGLAASRAGTRPWLSPISHDHQHAKWQAGAEHHVDPSALGFDATSWSRWRCCVVIALMVWKKVPAAIGRSLDSKIALHPQPACRSGGASQGSRSVEGRI